VETPDTEEEEGPPTVVYRSNGRCTPYKVRVVDSDGATVLITVDALSTAETTRER
jgi:hypothetical protein